MSTNWPFLALFGGVLALFALALLLGTLVPSARLSQSVPIDPSNLSLQSDGPATQRYPQDLSVLIDLPVQLVVGRTETVTIEVRPLPVTPPLAGTLRDATAANRPVAVARLSSSLATVRPDGDEGQSLASSDAVRFTWSLAASEPGAGELTLLVRLRFYPVAGGTPTERVLLARTLAATAVSVLGMSAPVAQSVGMVALAAGLGLMLTFGKQAVAWLRRA